VGPEEIEQLRRAVAMHTSGAAGALTQEKAEALIEQLLTARAETARYRQVVAELRAILDGL
jgi:hypothetical protein